MSLFKNIFQEADDKVVQDISRRSFLKHSSCGMLGSMALNSLMAEEKTSNIPHHHGTAKKVIFLHMAGAPSQLELFDYKPLLEKMDGKPCPESYLEGKKLAFAKGIPDMLGPQHKFNKYGESGTYVSDRLPHFQSIVDEVTLIKSMYTDQFNHAPAQLLMHTGFPRLGRPSMGSWMTYGLGSENNNLPSYISLISGGKVPSAGKSVWGSGFLPSFYQGVQCRSQGEPVMYSANPKGINRDLRRRTLDAINDMNRIQHAEAKDPETLARISQYEMAFRMQMSVPEAMDISKEPEYIRDMYGAQPGKASFANNCLLARRLIERDVRFVQLYDWGWDSHGNASQTDLHNGFADKCRDVDRPMAALIKDLKSRGMLDDTLVVWGGEFGRTPFRENRGGKYGKYVGRDHSPGAFTMWMAGGGAKKGFSYGETDEVGYNVAQNPVFIHDLQATMMHMMGFNHEKLTYYFQGRD
ncbi:MAG: DUF1501 domain-containing protein, partial [Lentisphaeraceae bacterium]|nr:DUF1501 domain-containing protein [Lentisphaeraceae bacterium]